MPDVAGRPLEVAKSTLQAVGISGHSRDVLRDRVQIVDSNWTVCTQDPAPGPAVKGAVVELGVVKDDEACPTAAQATSATPVPTTTLPQPTTTQAAGGTPPSSEARTQAGTQTCAGAAGGAGTST